MCKDNFKKMEKTMAIELDNETINRKQDQKVLYKHFRINEGLEIQHTKRKTKKEIVLDKSDKMRNSHKIMKVIKSLTIPKYVRNVTYSFNTMNRNTEDAWIIESIEDFDVHYNVL